MIVLVVYGLFGVTVCNVGVETGVGGNAALLDEYVIVDLVLTSAVLNDARAVVVEDVTVDLLTAGVVVKVDSVYGDILEDVVTIAMALNLKYGYNIMDISGKVQEKVKVAVENMTGLKVADVNIRVAGVEIEA